MKLKLNQLNPNPFKKEINGGKLSEIQIQKLSSNLDKLKLMGSIPVVKRGKEYYQISHHHRTEAMKRKFGAKYEVEVTIHNYTDAQMLRGMVIENLTQKLDDFNETMDNIAAIENFLNKNVMKKDEKATALDIFNWLDDSGSIISIDKITNMLNIKNKLSPELLSRVKNTQAGTEDEREEFIQETNAIYLSKIGRAHV